MPCIVKSCCCGCTLQSGVKTIAVVLATMSFFIVGYSSFTLGIVSSVDGDDSDKQIILGETISEIVLGILGFPFYILLFVGSIRGKRILMIPAMIIIVLNNVLFVCFLIIYLVFTIQGSLDHLSGSLYILGTVIDISIHVYFFIVIRSLFVHMRSHRITHPV